MNFSHWSYNQMQNYKSGVRRPHWIHENSREANRTSCKLLDWLHHTWGLLNIRRSNICIEMNKLRNWWNVGDVVWLEYFLCSWCMEGLSSNSERTRKEALVNPSVFFCQIVCWCTILKSFGDLTCSWTTSPLWCGLIWSYVIWSCPSGFIELKDRPLCHAVL